MVLPSRRILFFYFLSLIVALFTVQFAHAQGAGGGGSGGSGGGSGGEGDWSGGSWNGGGSSGSGYDSSSCDSEQCRRIGIVAGSVIGGFFGLSCLFFCCFKMVPACYSCCHDICYDLIHKCHLICSRKCSKKSSYQLDKSDIMLDPLPRTTTLPSISHTLVPSLPQIKFPPILHSTTTITNIFQSGTYNMRYYQYHKLHGPFLVQLRFKDGYVHGNGHDDVGAFNVTGNYSTSDNHLTLFKQYKRGTGDPHENLGHQVTIDLKWNDNVQHFDGKWVVRTAKYSGEDKFELKFRQHVETV